MAYRRLIFPAESRRPVRRIVRLRTTLTASPSPKNPAKLTEDTLSQLSRGSIATFCANCCSLTVFIFLELSTDEIDVRALASLEPTETVSAAAGKIKGRVSKWLGEQCQTAKPTKSLGRGYFAATTGQSTSEAVCDGWQALQSGHGMVIDKVSFLPDHVHVALALHPSKSPAEIVVAMMNTGQERMWRFVVQCHQCVYRTMGAKAVARNRTIRRTGPVGMCRSE